MPWINLIVEEGFCEYVLFWEDMENWAFWGDPQSGTVLVLLLSTPCLDAAGG